MENSKKRGLSFLIGYIGSGLLVVAFFMAFSYETLGSSIAGSFSQSVGIIGYLWTFIKVLFFPGLFVLCLIIKNKTKELNKTLAIFWIVISVISSIMYVVAMSTYSGSGLTGMLAGALVPSSMKVANWLRLLGALGVITSCVLLLIPEKQTSQD